ncbi:MAG: HesA/MoeB/ThiF family protein [Acidilobus sp.]
MSLDLTYRFSRQVLLSGIGREGMERIRNSKAAVIGCGALGSVEAELLARAGVGFIRVVDRDVVDLTNIHRTHMVGEKEAEEGTPKAIACGNGLKSIDSSIKVDVVVDDVDSDNVKDLIGDVDIVLDGSDNLETRFLINEAAVMLDKPWVYAGVNSWYGTVMFIRPRVGPCFRCFMTPMPPSQESCDVIPTIGTVTTMTGAAAAGLAIRYLAGDSPKPGELILIDGRSMNIEKVEVKRNPSCPVCALGRFEELSRPPSYGMLRLCGSRAYKVRLGNAPPLEAIARALQSRFAWVTSRPNWVRVVTKEGVTVTIMGRLAVIENAEDQEQARAAYDEVAEAAGLPKV